MIRICKKEDCNQPSIKRGKYCIDHCTVRKRVESFSPISSSTTIQFENISNETNNDNELRYIEDRMIMREQNREYEEAYKKDLENLRLREEMLKKEEEEKLNFEMEIKKKRQNDESRENDEFYKIKFVFSNLHGLTIISTFSRDDIFENIFNFIDVFLYDSSVSMGEYELISYPKIIINKDEHNKIKINEKIKSKNVQFMVKEKEVE
jgi:hypothetical protein